MPDSWLTTLGKAFARPDTSQEHVRFTTASPLVNITDEDINRGINVGLSVGPGSIKAYHGSPYNFTRFDTGKIGTGEGAQTYGHGLYFAEKEGTAKSYRDALSPKSGGLADSFLQKHGGDRQAALNEFDKYYKDMFPEERKILETGERPQSGHMYEVNINAQPEHFLDWDKPLNQQHPTVQENLKKTLGPNWDEFKYATGGTAVKNGLIAPSPEGTAASMGGIPGIKYLDQGSRAAGEGSSNYVVFNNKLIDIVKKYGLAGLLATPAFASRTDEGS